MRYLKTYEFFYYDGGPYYGGARDPSLPKPGELASRDYIYSDIDSKYYTEDEIREIELKYFEKYTKQYKIKDTKSLDDVLIKIREN